MEQVQYQQTQIGAKEGKGINNSGGDDYYKSPGWIERAFISCHPSTAGHNCGIEITRSSSEGGFFSESVSWDWGCGYNTLPTCCYDTTGSTNNNNLDATKKSRKEGCGGYIDYCGIYHACTNVKKLGRAKRSRAVEWHDQCQGCIFREGMSDVGVRVENRNEEDLYYDSDPGQFFAIESWTCSTYSPRTQARVDLGDEVLPQPHVNLNSISPLAHHRAKLPWKRKRIRSSHRQSHSIHGKDPRITHRTLNHDTDDINEDTPSLGDIQQQPLREPQEQQAFLYDYFSRNDAATGVVMRTGFYSTNESDVGYYVQARIICMTVIYQYHYLSCC